MLQRICYEIVVHRGISRGAERMHGIHSADDQSTQKNRRNNENRLFHYSRPPSRTFRRLHARMAITKMVVLNPAPIAASAMATSGARRR